MKAHQRRHQETVKFTEENGNRLVIFRKAVQLENGEEVQHFHCPYCEKAHYLIPSSLYKHIKESHKQKAQDPAAPAHAHAVTE